MKTFESLGLVNYQLLDLQIPRDGQNTRLQSHFLGYIPEKSLLLTLPRTPDGQLSTGGLLKAGDCLSVQVPTNSGIASFSTEVIGIAPTPFPVVHLAYPKSLSFANARKDPRVHINVPLEMTFASGVKSRGQFSDISVSGGCARIEHAGAEIGEVVQLAFDLSVAGVTRPMSLSAYIRSCLVVPDNTAANARGERTYGLEFQSVDELQTLIVSAFINGEMAKMHKGGVAINRSPQ